MAVSIHARLPPTPPMTEDESTFVKEMPRSDSVKTAPAPAPIWWSNAIFFVGMHVLALVGVFKLSPWWTLDRRTAWLCFISWQIATFGITMGYHRLWSHHAFTAKMPLRIILAAAGCCGFQGSIKWWVLRHRLHHRFTDSDDDPYDATRGLFFSHVGWIFRKPVYPRMALIDKRDLEADPVVRFQHRYYPYLALFFGLVAPTLIAHFGWGDGMGGYIWGGVFARLLIWHCTFMINSLAHYLGDQSYSLDVTARGNFLLSILTGGEAGHSYHHAFPKDYRNGPNALDWDPTKLLIWACSRFTPWVPSVHFTPEHEILAARAHVLHEQSALARTGPSPLSEDTLPSWPLREVVARVRQLTDERMATGSLKRPLVVLIDGFAVDAGVYASSHPGGVAILRSHAVKVGTSEDEERLPIDATAAFFGGLNDHHSAAQRLMRELRIAKIVG